MERKKISILGSTGSIGTQTLEVIKEDKTLEVVGLSTNVNIELLEKQIEEFKPKLVCVMNNEKATILKKRLNEKQCETKVVTGMDGLVLVATIEDVNIVLTAVVGMIGLVPTIEAIKAKKTIALANKETLVTAGELVMELAREYGVKILPVDSEHSAIFQALRGNDSEMVEKLILTASGGPFRGYTKSQLEEVNVEDALNHPNWSMGNKITIDSATMMNKGLEVIEAKYLFDVKIEEIEIVIHKESIIHSMVEYKDGSTMAQLGMPDMRHPISHALYYPNRHSAPYIPKLDWTTIKSMHFEKPDIDVFPCIKYAYDALKCGGTMPAVLNAANEIAVEAFLNKKISFTKIPQIIHEAMKEHICIDKPSLQEILKSDLWAREFSKERIEGQWQKL
ncbi:MAG: 1-deoxy-D-xylulose-5-phosphate reductoisomerase [Cellulosilyticaceae bacterium]